MDQTTLETLAALADLLPSEMVLGERDLGAPAGSVHAGCWVDLSGKREVVLVVEFDVVGRCKSGSFKLVAEEMGATKHEVRARRDLLAGLAPRAGGRALLAAGADGSLAASAPFGPALENPFSIQGPARFSLAVEEPFAFDVNYDEHGQPKEPFSASASVHLLWR